MRNSFKQLGLSKIANTQVNRLEQFDKLKEIANRNNYPYKIKQLTAKIQEEYDFWNLKSPSRKLEDITKDLIFIKSIKEPTLSKVRIDELIEKYGLK
jgi:uncharacterized HAD superfamily protein